MPTLSRPPISNQYKPSVSLLAMDFSDSVVSAQPASPQSDWITFKDITGAPAGTGIFYEAGTAADRGAFIAPDPTDPADSVLYFYIQNPVVPDGRGKFKARVQMGFTNISLDEIFIRYRMYLSPNFELVKYWPESNAVYALGELWLGEAWNGHPFPARIKVTLSKLTIVGKQALYLAAGLSKFIGGDPKFGVYEGVWGVVNYGYEMPVEEWVDIQIGYKMGDARGGRFYLGAKRGRETLYTTIADVNYWTYNPDSPAPVPLVNLQIPKLYMRGSLVEYARPLTVGFDNLQFFQTWT